MSDDELKSEAADDMPAEPATRKPRTYLRAHDGTVTVSDRGSRQIEPDPAAPARHDPVAAVQALGLRSDTPRALVKSIVGAVQARDGKDLEEVKLALSNFNLPTLLESGATVHSLATGLVDLAHSGEWKRLTPENV